MGLFLVFASSCKKDNDDKEQQDEIKTFTDARDGNVYKCTTIGGRVWMAENLKYLPKVEGTTASSDTLPLYYVYNYEGTNVNVAKASDNYKTYGVLYNWPAAMNGAPSNSNPIGVQGVCPSGWHLPNDAEWSQLTAQLGGDSIAGGKLKETGTSHWANPNTEASNETGFTALPAGSLVLFSFGFIGKDTYYWTSTQPATGGANYRKLSSANSRVDKSWANKQSAFSVRCVKD